MKKKEIKDFLKSIYLYSVEKRLFMIISLIGEMLEGSLHIIKMESTRNTIYYRVYHKNGYCFDTYTSEEDHGLGPSITYGYYAEWEGFDALNVTDACFMMEKFIIQIHKKIK